MSMIRGDLGDHREASHKYSTAGIRSQNRNCAWNHWKLSHECNTCQNMFRTRSGWLEHCYLEHCHLEHYYLEHYYLEHCYLELSCTVDS